MGTVAVVFHVRMVPIQIRKAAPADSKLVPP